jgi:hypothetical protein
LQRSAKIFEGRAAQKVSPASEHERRESPDTDSRVFDRFPVLSAFA